MRTPLSKAKWREWNFAALFLLGETVGVYILGPSKGPCTATILPTLLGFGGIQ